LITDPLPEDRPKIRLPPGWPEEAPPNFALREGRSEILTYGERVGEFLRMVRRRICSRVAGTSSRARS
jgi:hypothetical protein